MKINIRFLFYFFLTSFIFALDRISKYFIFNYLNNLLVVNNFLYFTKTFNKGISWGIFNNSSDISFYLVTSFVIAITVGLIFYAIKRYKENNIILGEVLVISGSISNVIDRFYYGAVLDFINVNIFGWQYPGIFNVADCAIVFGVIVMFFELRD